jgi:hypothetical protein
MRAATPATSTFHIGQRDRDQNAEGDAADQVGHEDPGPVGDHGAPARPALETGKRHQRKAAGNELEAEQHDHHEADREDQCADERLARGDGAVESECGRRAQQRSGQGTADQQIARRERELPHAGINHRNNNARRLYVIHFELQPPRVWRGPQRGKKDETITRVCFASDPVSLVAADIHLGLGLRASPPVGLKT